MKRNLIRQWFTGRLLLAALAGLIWAVAFPKPGWAAGAWVAPGLLLALALGEKPGGAFRLGYVAGLVHHPVALGWLLLIPFPVGAVAGLTALSAYLALFPATWVWLCLKLMPAVAQTTKPESPGSGLPSPAAQTPVSNLDRLQMLAGLTCGQRLVWSLACATIWVALEIVRGRFLSGFPWNFLGASQYANLPLIQVASFTGVYGVSFLIVWTSVSVLGGFAVLATRRPPGLTGNHSLPGEGTTVARRSLAPLSGASLPGANWFGAPEVVVPLVTLSLIMMWGVSRITSARPAKRFLNVALVQPSIPQELIFNPNETTNRFNKLIDLTRQALATQPDLVVWPEAALPGFNEERFKTITNLIATAGVPMIFGADDAEAVAPGSDKYRYYNSAFLLDAKGRVASDYRKRKLVIFGEYVPLTRWLPFLRYLTPIEGGFTPGDKPGEFRLDRPYTRIAPLICFEDVFPHVVPDCVTPDTDFLLNLTNNGWFGEGSAQWQHGTMAAFRAVENGVPLVRCTNNGLSCWIDEFGGLHDVYFAGSQDIYRAGIKLVRVPLLGPGEKRAATYYQRQGDRFGWSCLILAGAMVARRVKGSREVKS